MEKTNCYLDEESEGLQQWHIDQGLKCSYFILSYCLIYYIGYALRLEFLKMHIWPTKWISDTSHPSVNKLYQNVVNTEIKSTLKMDFWVTSEQGYRRCWETQWFLLPHHLLGSSFCPPPQCQHFLMSLLSLLLVRFQWATSSFPKILLTGEWGSLMCLVFPGASREMLKFTFHGLTSEKWITYLKKLYEKAHVWEN